ncbi:pentapeptide repeat-containing protein [Candidatus Uhrbacteria bacterium]|nr:pentapeptide repeat-containing protein [Candidatus Uhrbacteria bacterium]
MREEFSSGAERPKLTRVEVEERLARGEHMERVDLHDEDLTGLELRGKRFRDSIVYGLQLYRGDGDPATEVRTDIRETDWTDARMGSIGAEAFFGRVNAEGAVFGFTETLAERRQRHAASDQPPTDLDSGGYHNFNSAEGNFQRTTWRNIDFGGGTGYEARLEGADLRGATFDGCDLAELDFSTALVNEGTNFINCRTDGLRLPNEFRSS